MLRSLHFEREVTFGQTKYIRRKHNLLKNILQIQNN